MKLTIKEKQIAEMIARARHTNFIEKIEGDGKLKYPINISDSAITK